jgi:hypothetical protein
VVGEAREQRPHGRAAGIVGGFARGSEVGEQARLDVGGQPLHELIDRQRRGQDQHHDDAEQAGEQHPELFERMGRRDVDAVGREPGVELHAALRRSRSPVPKASTSTPAVALPLRLELAMRDV